MPRRENTRGEILEAAGRLLLERGYHGFSYKDIAEPLGVRNAAIHYHFPSKEDLGVVLIEDYREELRRNTADFMARGGNPANQLEVYIHYTREALRSQRLCPMGVLAIDFAGLPPPDEASTAAADRGNTRLADPGS